MTLASVADWLLDTGPLVALLSTSDAAHARCKASFESFSGHLVTTEPILTEAMHMIRRARGAHEACLRFFLDGGGLLVPTNAARLRACSQLMSRYQNVPMDFADASLVALGDELGIGRVFTLDHRGFATYRWRKNRRFEIAP